MLLTPLVSRAGFEPRRAVVFSQDAWTPVPACLKRASMTLRSQSIPAVQGFRKAPGKADRTERLKTGADSRMRQRNARRAEFFALPALNRLHDVVGDFIYWPVLFYDQGIMGLLQSRQLAIEQLFWEEMSRSLLEAFGECRFVDVQIHESFLSRDLSLESYGRSLLRPSMPR